MAKFCRDPARLVRRSFPDSFFEDSLRSLFLCSVRAHEHFKRTFQPPEFHDGIGDYRRLLFEQEWREAAHQYLPKIRGTSERNEANTHSYTCITRGVVAMTESHVTDQWRPQFACFRRQLAQPNRRLFDDQEGKPSPASRVYAILAYKMDADRRFPVAANIVFPDPTYREILEARIKLFDEFPYVVEQMMMKAEKVVHEEMVVQPATPKLLADILRKTD